MNTRAQLAKKISATETLKQMPIGKSLLIKTKDIKKSALETAKRRLNQRGFSFIVSEAGLIDEVSVTRVK